MCPRLLAVLLLPAVSTAIKVGDVAPEFSLPTILEETVELSDFTDHRVSVLLWFYDSRDSDAAALARSMQERHAKLGERGVVIVGISGEQLQTSEQFADQHGLEFALASDTTLGVARSYGVTGVQNTVVHIDGTGRVAEIFLGDFRPEAFLQGLSSRPAVVKTPPHSLASDPRLKWAKELETGHNPPVIAKPRVNELEGDQKDEL
jgi:peroxiredoxin